MNYLVLWDKARQAIAECKTIDEVKQIRDKAEALRAYAKQAKESLLVQNDCAEIKLRAERRIGEFSRELPKNPGKYQQTSHDGESDKTSILAEAGITHCERYEAIASLPDELFEKHVKEIKASNEELTTVGILKVARQIQRDSRIDNIIKEPLKGKYGTIVIDPPWPMEKILRDVTPNQIKFDYPTMSLEEIAKIKLPATDDCHVFMWSTQKFLPDSFDIFEAWGVKYVFAMVWHKNGGFQPFNLPQYNCEFVLYGRIGTPVFIDTKQFNLCFSADRTGHSEKPEFFYATVRRVTAEGRIDIFSRRKIDGFDRYGNEI